MAGKFPSIPDPGSDPATQSAALRALKQTVELLVANATGQTNSQGVGASSQVFALNLDMQNALIAERNARTNALSTTNQTLTDVSNALTAATSAAQADAAHARADAANAFSQLQDIVQKVFTLTDTVGAAHASVTVEAGARATADTALAGQITTIQSTINNNDAKYENQIATLTTTTTSLASSLTTLNTKVDNNNANLTNQLTTETTARTALANNFSSLSAVVGTGAGLTGANITSELIATANQASSTATAVTTLTSTVAGQTTSIKTISTAVGNIGGQYSVSIDQNNPPNVVGFQLLNTPQNVAGPASAFNIRADSFNITLPGYAPTPVMTVQTVNGVPQLAFKGNIIADGTINTPSVANYAISDNRGYTAVGSNSAPIGGMYLNSGDRVSIIGTGGGGGAQAGGQGTLTVYWARIVNGNTVDSGAVGTIQVTTALVNSGVLGYNGAYYFVGSYMYPPGAILRTFLATTAGNYSFSVYNLLGGDTSIVVIRLSR